MILAIIQARMGSTRLPGKVLADICGKPMLGHVIDRVRKADSVDRIVVATSVDVADDAVADFCRQHGTECFRGSESDVLDRFYNAARQLKADVVVRVTGDCPFIDPEVVDKVISTFLSGNYDYVSNILRYTYPDGLDVEVFSSPALEAAWRSAVLPAEREHVTPYIRTAGTYRLGNVENDTDLSSSNLRWSVDDSQDLEFARAVFRRLNGNGCQFGLNDVLGLLQREPALQAINADKIRNSGYYVSLSGESPIPARDRILKRSYELKSKGESLIPSCTQTFSKGPSQYVQGVAPVYLDKGQGSHVWDVDGNEYIDFAMGLGPVILGHNYPAVTGAVIHQVQNGTAFSLPHPIEIEVAEVLADLIPCAEMVRFGKNGSDVTAGAVRAARAYTGREVIACCGYHGWQDWYIGTTTRNKGVPKAVQALTIPFEYNNVGSLNRIFDTYPNQIAAVIMEPVGIVEPKDDFLRKVRDLTLRKGAVLVFDEVVTGFRLALGGAQEYFGVEPDLACFGKAMGNGYPISAVVGRREIMEVFDDVFFSFTFGGEAASLAAAKATINAMQRENVIGHLWEQGKRLQDGYNVLAKKYGVDGFTKCIGLPPRTVITFKDENGEEWLILKSLFQQECIKRGILFSGGQNICFSHSDADVDYTLRVYRTALEIIAEAIKAGDVEKRLEGGPVQAVFRKP